MRQNFNTRFSPDLILDSALLFTNSQGKIASVIHYNSYIYYIGLIRMLRIIIPIGIIIFPARGWGFAFGKTFKFQKTKILKREKILSEDIRYKEHVKWEKNLNGGLQK